MISLYRRCKSSCDDDKAIRNGEPSRSDYCTSGSSFWVFSHGSSGCTIICHSAVVSGNSRRKLCLNNPVTPTYRSAALLPWSLLDMQWDRFQSILYWRTTMIGKKYSFVFCRFQLVQRNTSAIPWQIYSLYFYVRIRVYVSTYTCMHAPVSQYFPTSTSAQGEELIFREWYIRVNISADFCTHAYIQFYPIEVRVVHCQLNTNTS